METPQISKAGDTVSGFVPKSLTRLFQEYAYEDIDLELYVNTLIERTLEMGTWEELHWLFHTYGVPRIVNYLRRLGHRRLSARTFNYWCKFLSIENFRRASWSQIGRDVWNPY